MGEAAVIGRYRDQAIASMKDHKDSPGSRSAVSRPQIFLTPLTPSENRPRAALQVHAALSRARLVKTASLA